MIGSLAPISAEVGRPGYAQLIAENAADLLSLEDVNDRYVYVSSSCAKLFGWQQRELNGGRISELLHPQDAQRVAKERALLRRCELTSLCHRYRLRCRSGEYRWVESHSQLCLQAPEYVVTLTRDIQDHVEQLQELEWRASYDSLTGVFNRHAMEAALDAEFSRAGRQGQVLSVALFDVDGLKRINDTYGHLAGDALLRSLASCAARCKRSYDIFGRWGGDEFMLALPNTAIKEAMTILARIRVAVSQDLPGVTLSFGASSSARDGCVADLLREADRALYQGKRGGGNTIVTWSEA